jgi:hypothetical protein
MHHARHRTAPTTRKKTMNVIWHWPKPKSRRAIGSRPRTTTSTPNIILGRCPRTESDIGFHIRTRARETEFFRATLSPPIRIAPLIVARSDYVVPGVDRACWELGLHSPNCKNTLLIDDFIQKAFVIAGHLAPSTQSSTSAERGRSVTSLAIC